MAQRQPSDVNINCNQESDFLDAAGSNTHGLRNMDSYDGNRDSDIKWARCNLCLHVVCGAYCGAGPRGLLCYCFCLSFFTKISIYKVALQCFGVVGWPGVRFPFNLYIKFPLLYKIDLLV